MLPRRAILEIVPDALAWGKPLRVAVMREADSWHDASAPADLGASVPRCTRSAMVAVQIATGVMPHAATRLSSR